MAMIIDGKRIADEIREEVRVEVAALKASKGIVPGLAVVLVGDDPASDVYVRMKGKACEELGLHSVTDRLPASTTEAALLKRVAELNADPAIHGILVQMPLPKHINEARVIEAIDPVKDVDGFHPVNVGKLIIGEDTLRPCTPAGVQELLLRSNIDPAGMHVVVVGRSNIVGKPVASILMQKQKGANAIVTIAHTGAKDLRPYLVSADILIAAIGRPESIRGEDLKTGVVVIDVGISRVDDATAKKGYRLVGDVHFASASTVASAITPVPGGVGPMTIAMLMKNTLKACRWKSG
ncbi:MAG: bifunctional 5,10-methylenetetrahydrofolate dehydrogenase/5,10-methenyltetrahydrofolate cyclohydrolase [Bacteroidetes bacterium]|jgi:methylenetetrahydrofolate dehydrogenase (NADP+)/methenyltetrahydrofolate cyclohydrolase|nr:bifunctional 5,10-methylenetetrahydrofolate dehydrogenase/5,10-methenyltetrahydrofolate cyclohydrolase [Bacteroidota bacterium]